MNRLGTYHTIPSAAVNVITGIYVCASNVNGLSINWHAEVILTVELTGLRVSYTRSIM